MYKKSSLNPERDADTSRSSSDSSTDESEPVRINKTGKNKLDGKSKYPKGDIRNIIFEKINNEFSKGIYGGYIVTVMNNNGYINTTRLCDKVIEDYGDYDGRVFENWEESKQLRDLVKNFSKEENIPKSQLIIEVNRSRICPEMIIGTYVHPTILPHLMAWILPTFGFKLFSAVNPTLTKKTIEKKKTVREKHQPQKVQIKANEKEYVEKKELEKVYQLLNQQQSLLLEIVNGFCMSNNDSKWDNPKDEFDESSTLESYLSGVKTQIDNSVENISTEESEPELKDKKHTDSFNDELTASESDSMKRSRHKIVRSVKKMEPKKRGPKKESNGNMIRRNKHTVKKAESKNNYTNEENISVLFKNNPVAGYEYTFFEGKGKEIYAYVARHEMRHQDCVFLLRSNKDWKNILRKLHEEEKIFMVGNNFDIENDEDFDESMLEEKLL